MAQASYFSPLEDIPIDPIMQIMQAYKADEAPGKIDVSVGVYKTEEGDPNYVFPCVKKAKEILAANDPGHCYTQMSGIPAFVSAAQRTIFGDNHDDVVSVQAISGSGSLHLAFTLLRSTGFSEFYVGTPCWSNYQGMIEHVGGNYHTFRYYHPETHGVDFDATLQALQSAPDKSVFVLQAVCHNPTGCDYTRDQWAQILKIFGERDLFLVFDCAYQGFASGSVAEDAWAIRQAYDAGLEFMVCQSFSKNLGLYSERAGCTHVRVRDAHARANVFATLVSIIRHELSFAPAFGARVATIVQDQLQEQWAEDVLSVTRRLKTVREKVLKRFVEMGTPGKWEPIIKQNGLFWYSGLTKLQVQKLMDEHHVYGTLDGRVNVAGLNDSNIEAFCQAVDATVRKYPFDQ
ncbi:putative aspartate aminotransferase [Clavispora lusitaniae]|uniref:Aspartate aminotransferase n=1 Tax=Clavispora lusitaniae TaxID=36911 RepID=A0ACD0WNY7_CLALS|nr:hypothetical protein E0198_004123 [Clavispora lusitaniae]QFZ29264.1 putative aspartate aminotransferase [Clavispora lusitaniae]QFZ34927.1 putative aspartate aminotransferase [Clavispora lusitaniae]QFZ40612.1 putative aspartate aminotransferase [Clavispora lusitaniae]QFZ46292.1 putative aspartate aminotransferase [Clavispora lusitaniae]